MAKRFIVDENNILVQENAITVKGEEVHHINVLRYKVGDKLYINSHEIEITKLSKEVLNGNIIGNLPQKGVPRVSITLIQSYLKSDKMDYVVQKAVELGVKNIIPAISKNTIVKLDEKDKLKKVERLSKIAKEAVEQCGRADTVIVQNVQNLSNLDMSCYEMVLICHETSNIKLKEVIENIKNLNNIAVIIGPEGGLDEQEVKEILKKTNTQDISLGERILRAETASLSILSILSYELE